MKMTIRRAQLVAGYRALLPGAGLLLLLMMVSGTGAQAAGVARQAGVTSGQRLLSMFNPTPADGDRFGDTVGANTGGILISSPYNENTSAPGTVFQFNYETGDIVRGYRAQQIDADASFGFSFYAKYDQARFFIGMDRSNAISAEGGAVFGFQKQNPVFQFQFGSAGAGVAGIGRRMAADARRVYVSAPLTSSGAGAIYAFDLTTTAGLLYTIGNPQGLSQSGFGTGGFQYRRGRLYVGTPIGYDLNTSGSGRRGGSVQAFNTQAGKPKTRYTDPDVQTTTTSDANSDAFGASLVVLGNRLYVGDPGEDVNGVEDAGAVYVFDIKTSQALSRIDNPRPEVCGRFGASIAGQNKTLCIGAPNASKEDEANGYGMAFVYPTAAADAPPALEFSDPQTDPLGLFGFSVAAFQGDKWLVGAPGAAVLSGGRNQGAAYVYQSIVKPRPARRPR